MKSIFSLIFCLSFAVFLSAQEGLAEDYLSKEFHKNRREALRNKMSKNTVAVFFANPVRNRANDVEYVYHQDPNFYYLTGYKEPHAVLVIFSEMQTNSEGKTYNEILYVQERNARYEMWTGKRLGTEGAKNKLGFDKAFNGKDFLNSGIDFTKYDEVLFDNFKDDYRDSKRNKADMYDLVESFKIQIGYYLEVAKADTNDFSNVEIKKETNIVTQKANINTKSLSTFYGRITRS